MNNTESLLMLARRQHERPVRSHTAEHRLQLSPSIPVRATWSDDAHRRTHHGEGHVSLANNEITFTPSSATRRCMSHSHFVHQGQTMKIKVGRLSRPWANTQTVLHNQHGSLELTTSTLAGRKFRKALCENGVTVQEQHSWRLPDSAI